MRALMAWLFCLCFAMFSFGALANSQDTEKTPNKQPLQSDVRNLEHSVKNIVSDIDILRRDQVNYRIEKDLLKDTYSSNLERVNVVITIVFGIFGILGYLGLRNINQIKADYTKELHDLKKLRNDFEFELKTFKDKQLEIEGKVSFLTKTNEEQDGRLKVLELTEKAAEFMGSKQWQWALQYINLGLNIDENNLPLLSQKALCHGKLGEFSAAIETSKKMIALEPEEKSDLSIMNMLEYCLLGNQDEEYQKTYLKHQELVNHFMGGNAVVYLSTFKNILKGNLEEAKTILVDFAQKFPGEIRQFLGKDWSFDDLLNVVNRLPDGRQKELSMKSIQYFDGKINSNEFVAYLNLLT
jgi:tetratricopeptide (TPR) repeat protein